MYCHQNLMIVGFCSLANCLTSSRENLAHIIPGTFPANFSVGFITNLNHSYIYTSVQKFFQAFCCKQFYCTSFLRNIHRRPCFWSRLFCWICPEIRIMEIDEHLHSCVCSPFSNQKCCVNIIISTTVSISFAIVRIVPHTNSYIINSTSRQKIEKSLVIYFSSIVIIKLHATVF